MGVYIPNMNKPKNCRTCNFKSNKEGECWFVHDENDCPLIEIDLVRCGECKYFNLNEWDETICGVPIIVAHEICHKWGDGCKTNIYGFCFMGERRADDNTD